MEPPGKSGRFKLINAACGSVGFLLNMTGHETETAKVIGTAAVFNVVMNLLLAPRFGLQGAAVATAVTFLLWNALLWRFAARCLGIRLFSNL